MNTLDRRSLLLTGPNPDPGSDYAVGLDFETRPTTGLGPVKIVIRYVPDKLLLQPSCLRNYLSALAENDWPTPEALALVLRDDISNELVPRWIEILVAPPDTGATGVGHSVLLEDRQPQWNNPNLLGRVHAMIG